jgi:hypothetical protein
MGTEEAQDEFVHLQARDKEKADVLCLLNIPLLTIPYWELHRIQAILDEAFSPAGFRMPVLTAQPPYDVSEWQAPEMGLV